MPSVVAGIDPGLSGAIAFLDECSNRLAGVYDLPLIEGPDGCRNLDERAFEALLEKHCPRLVVMEHVQGFGGVSSAFKLGATFGALICCVRGRRFRLEFVRPQTWQASILGCTDRNATKPASILVAALIAPAAALIRGKGRKPDHNRADAINIARYASRAYPNAPVIDTTRKAGK